MSKNPISKHVRKIKTKNFIHMNDVCFFYKPTEVYPAEQDFSYCNDITRIIWPGEPLVYIRRKRKGFGGVWVHCFESYGLKYVYLGSIKDFTKSFVPYKEGWE